MDTDQKKTEKNKRVSEDVKTDTKTLSIPTADGSAGATGSIHGVAAPPGIVRLRWSSMGSLIVAIWAFAIVLFYIIRFSVSFLDAGAKGLYGL
jgi:hypothetical protein